MRRLENLNFLVIFSILFLINESSGLKCWRCSSDASNSKFCGASIDLSQITELQKRYNYAECDAKPPSNVQNSENLIPKCRVLLQLVNNVETYQRSCHWEEQNVPADTCKVQKFNPSFVKTIDCKTCVEDGCNDKLITVAELKVNATTEAASKNISNNNDSNDNHTNNNKINENSTTNSPSSAKLAVLSHTILFVSMVIGF